MKPFGRSRTIHGMGNVEFEDDRLWSRSLKGDGDAFGMLFDRHRDRVFRHAYRLTANRLDAEDVMAAAFLELWRRRQKVRLVKSSVLPWLLVTATNMARNNGRAARRHRKLLDSLPRADTTQAGPEDDPGLQEGLDGEVALALGTLNPMDLRLVSLVVFEEYTLAAAAELLKLTPAAAKSRMHRARQRMRAAIDGSSKTTLAPALKGEIS